LLKDTFMGGFYQNPTHTHVMIRLRGVIFVQLILDNFGDNHFSPLVIGQKQ